jgi:hypothetical protein
MSNDSNPTIASQVSLTGAESAEAKASAGTAPTVAAIAEARSSLKPPQSAGAPQRLYSTGSPTTYEKLNVAMKVLRDPVARATFSRSYSGQARNWNR